MRNRDTERARISTFATRFRCACRAQPLRSRDASPAGLSRRRPSFRCLSSEMHALRRSSSCRVSCTSCCERHEEKFCDTQWKLHCSVGSAPDFVHQCGTAGTDGQPPEDGCEDDDDDALALGLGDGDGLLDGFGLLVGLVVVAVPGRCGRCVGAIEMTCVGATVGVNSGATVMSRAASLRVAVRTTLAPGGRCVINSDCSRRSNWATAAARSGSLGDVAMR